MESTLLGPPGLRWIKIILKQNLGLPSEVSSTHSEKAKKKKIGLVNHHQLWKPKVWNKDSSTKAHRQKRTKYGLLRCRWQGLGDRQHFS